MKIYGKNVALEALKENKKVHKIYLSNKFKDEEILSLIERKNINTKLLDNRELDKMCKGLHQGIILEVEDIKTYSFDEIIPNITTEYPLIVILDHLEDPHNLGAIVRSSEASCNIQFVQSTGESCSQAFRLHRFPAKYSAIGRASNACIGSDIRTCQPPKQVFCFFQC